MLATRLQAGRSNVVHEGKVASLRRDEMAAGKTFNEDLTAGESSSFLDDGRGWSEAGNTVMRASSGRSRQVAPRPCVSTRLHASRDFSSSPWTTISTLA